LAGGAVTTIFGKFFYLLLRPKRQWQRLNRAMKFFSLKTSIIFFKKNLKSKSNIKNNKIRIKMTKRILKRPTAELKNSIIIFIFPPF